MTKKLATEIRYQMTQEEQLFDFRKTDTPPILLLLDRRDDPITPYSRNGLTKLWYTRFLAFKMAG